MSLEERVKKSLGFLQKIGRFPLLKELTLFGCLSGFSLFGCSKDSNPIAPTTKINQPPNTFIEEVETFGNPSTGILNNGVKFLVRGTDDERVNYFESQLDNGSWRNFGASRGDNNDFKGVVSFTFYNLDPHVINIRAVDNRGERDPTPVTYDYFIQSTPTTPIVTSEQKHTSSSSGKIIINSTQGDTYNISLVDKDNKQPITGLTLYYEEGTGGKIIMIEDSQKRYYSNLETIVDNTSLSSSLAGSSSFVLEFEKKIAEEFVEGLKNVKFIDVEVNMPEPRSDNLQLIATGVRADQLPEIYNNHDFLIKNKSILNFVFENTGYSWASVLGDFRQEFIENTDNMVYIMRDLRQGIDPNTPMYDYVFDVYAHKTMGVLIHKIRKVPVNLYKTSFLLGFAGDMDASISTVTTSSGHSDWYDKNYGADSLLYLGHVNYGVKADSYFLLKFALLGYSTSRRVAKAELILNAKSFGGAGQTGDKFRLYAYNILSNWEENTVTWVNPPQIAENSLSQSEIYSAYTSEDLREIKIDIADIVKKWLKEGNNGVLIDLLGLPENTYGARNVTCYIHSSEHPNPNLWPRLHIYSY